MANRLSEGGCTLADLIDHAVKTCSAEAQNHEEFVGCFVGALRDLKDGKVITRRERKALKRCGGKADLP